MALPKDELELISKKLPYSPDYIRFRSVCQSWRSAAPRHPQIPWLVVLVDGTYSDEFRFYFYQFCFESNKFSRIIELPSSQLISAFKAGSTDFIGSSHGWWALFNRGTLSVSLHNPLTNSKIDLPNLRCLKDDAFCYDSREIFGFTLTSDPYDSLSDCFALLYFFKSIFYCKIGCSAWIEMENIDLEYANFCSYRGMTFIASRADVFVCDFGQHPRFRKIASLSLKEDLKDNGYYFRNSYLFELNGDLSLLLACCTFNCEAIDFYDHRSNCDCGYIYFRAIKLDLIGCNFVKFEEIKSLGDKTLFLSEKNIFCLTASSYPGCKENSIYISLMENHSIPGHLNYLDRYDFEKGSTSSIAVEEVQADSESEYVFWFAPNLSS